MEKKQTEIKNLKSGSFVLIDDIPCQVEDVQISKAGKHGSAKARIVAKGVFANLRKDVVKPGDTKVDMPIIEKVPAQVISKSGDHVQLMDLQDYSTYEVPKPEFDVNEGDEVLVWRFGSFIAIKSKR